MIKNGKMTQAIKTQNQKREQIEIIIKRQKTCQKRTIKVKT